MEEAIKTIRDLFRQYTNADIFRIEKIPQSGSNRNYFRIHDIHEKTYIATQSNHVKENKAFLYFTETFEKIHAPVPKILINNSDFTVYIQEDLGDVSLLHMLEKYGQNEKVFHLFEKALHALAHLQVNADSIIDYNQCLTNKGFGYQAIMSDLLYFKYYFLDTLQIPYDKEKLLTDFETVSHYLADNESKYFLFRDFQSRNIMVKDEEVYFIDYQGGMKGALQYDVASLLWQAKANLSDDWKEKLLEYYIDCIETTLKGSVDRSLFKHQYHGYVLIRLLQVLGAYGFRGLFERKAHFLSSIPLALKNVQSFLKNKDIGISIPFFQSLLEEMVSEKTIQQFEISKATEHTQLTVQINSFSFIQNGYPKDETNNGGGYVFDCRGILNPGRIDEYKTKTGLDKPVKEFLEQQTKMPDFLNSIFDIVDITVENYIQRGFENLDVNFGCTGGQHRSVYAAEALNRHLKNKFGVKTTLTHLNSENWVQ